MLPRSSRALAALTLVTALVPTTAASPAGAHSALLKRGGLDAACGSGRPFCQIDAGGNRLFPWVVTAGSVDLVPTTYWQSQSGADSVDLAGNTPPGPGTLRQTVATTAGTTYRLTFWYAGNPECGAPVKKMRVTWDGATVAITKADVTGRTTTDMRWARRTVLVTATSDASVLEFADITAGGGPCGATLDNVRLAAV